MDCPNYPLKIENPRKKIPKDILLQLFKTIVRPVLEYGDVVWTGLTKGDQNSLESVQYRAARMISGHHGLPYPSHQTVYSQLRLPSLTFRRKFHTLTTLFKLLNGHCPPHLQSLLPSTRLSATESRYPLRNGRNLSTQIPKSVRTQKAFFHTATQLWNSLPVETRTATSLRLFKAKAWGALGDPFSVHH